MDDNGTARPEQANDPGGEDATLGGYLRVHKRPPAFEGADGQPYTVSIETERTANLRAPWAAYLVFPKWAETGLGVVGHVETPLLWEAAGEEAAVRQAGETPLERVKELLDEAIREKAAEAGEGKG